MKFDIVMISAKQGGGKTTTAGAIRDRMKSVDPECVVEEMIFAGPIYDMHNACRKVLTDAGIELNPKVKVKDGDLLQYLGTEWGRKQMGDNVWVDVIRGRVKNLRKEHEEKGTKKLLVVIPDLRFENEFHAFPEALNVRLECPEHIRKERVMKTSMWRDNTAHASEVSLDDYAARGKFDLYRSTESDSPQFIAAQIVQRLQSRH